MDDLGVYPFFRKPPYDLEVEMTFQGSRMLLPCFAGALPKHCLSLPQKSSMKNHNVVRANQRKGTAIVSIILVLNDNSCLIKFHHTHVNDHHPHLRGCSQHPEYKGGTTGQIKSYNDEFPLQILNNLKQVGSSLFNRGVSYERRVVPVPILQTRPFH